jgi:membrane protein DedA with SNARE-associated domain
VNLEAMMTVVVISAIIGDSVGYIVGRTAGPWLLRHWPLRERSSVQRAKDLLERRGGPAVFIGRFVTFARAVVPGLAGMSGLRYRTFLAYNALGGLLWGV